MVPARPLPAGTETIGVGEEFYSVLRRGLVNVRRGRIAAFSDTDTVLLDTGEQVNADVVIFATGWRQNVTFLDPELRRDIQQDGRFQLYRFILPPRERRLGFIGYASSSACPLLSEISAHSQVSDYSVSGFLLQWRLDFNDKGC